MSRDLADVRLAALMVDGIELKGRHSLSRSPTRTADELAAYR